MPPGKMKKNVGRGGKHHERVRRTGCSPPPAGGGPLARLFSLPAAEPLRAGVSGLTAKSHETNVSVPEGTSRCGGFREPFRQAKPCPHALCATQSQHCTTRPDATEWRTHTESMARSETPR